MDTDKKLDCINWLRDKLVLEMDQLELDMDSQKDFYEDKVQELRDLGEYPYDDEGVANLNEMYLTAKDELENYEFIIGWLDLVIDQIENDE